MPYQRDVNYVFGLISKLKLLFSEYGHLWQSAGLAVRYLLSGDRSSLSARLHLADSSERPHNVSAVLFGKLFCQMFSRNDFCKKSYFT